VSERAFTVRTVELDLAALAAAFGRRLHDAGVPVTPERAARFAEALTIVRPVARRRLYWTARATLVSDATQVRTFDAVFAEVFGTREGDAVRPVPADARSVPAAPDHRTVEDRRVDRLSSEFPQRGISSAGSRPPAEGEPDDDGRELAVPVVASDEERLRSKRFDALDAGELARLYHLMSRLEVATPTRRTRRAEDDRRGEHVDMRRTLRGSLRTAGDPIRLSRRRRRIVRRRIVMLCDISGSMEPYARAYLQFLTCAAGAGRFGGGPSAANSEAFVFATRLTRVTRALQTRSPAQAIQRAAAAAPDWSSGTRIGDALREFNDRHGRRGLARGAIVVIISDGWERGDPALVGREMARLARLAHRIIWVNPRVSARSFSPRAGGMAAALEHCDALVSGHSLDALEEVAEAIAAEDGSADWRAMVAAKPDAAPATGSDEDEEPWGSATPVPGSSVAMPSGYGPSRGNTTPGWSLTNR
jgi:uncharacterized protein with von Willebrand factor type A (vWA) domain